LEFSASFGFIHKESVTMHGHTIVKKLNEVILNSVSICILEGQNGTAVSRLSIHTKFIMNK